MWLINTALRRPFTILVLVIGIALGSALAIKQMPVDIFPNLNLPVIYVAQPYGGMDPAQMESFLVSYYEYHFLYVAGIEHVESRSIQNVGLLKLYFHPGTDMSQALAQVISYVERAKAFMPPGTVNPFVMRFDAGSVPVGQLVFSSETRGVADIADLALFRVRPQFSTLPGVSAPPPFGGNQRTVIIRVEPEKLRAFSMSPEEVAKAIAANNAILPSGNVRTGDLNRMAPMNGVVRDIQELADVPIRSGSGANVYIRDIGRVENGSDILTGYGLVNGRRTVYIPVTKRSDASTLDVVNNVKAALPRFQSLVPEDIKVTFEFDQSTLVKNSIRGLVFEGLLGALLTGVMVLLFLRDWRSALIVVTTIPFAILAGIVGLWMTGQTINLMTLGGLALAIGILVDESTVAIENIHTHLSRGENIKRSIFDATRETITPRLLAMLSVLAVFVPSFFMTGVAKSLFIPLTLAVGFAMLASYLLSSTLVPVLSAWLLRNEFRVPPSGGRVLSSESPPPEGGTLNVFDRLRSRYESFLSGLMKLRWPIFIAYLLVAFGVIYFVGGRLGTDIFPDVDTGMFQLRLRAPVGTRVERTEVIALKALDAIKTETGDKVDISLGYVGTQPASYPINTIHLWMSGSHEAVITIALKPGSGIRIADLKERLRKKLPEVIPGTLFSFEAGDVVTKIMNFGAPTPVEVAVSGPNLAANRGFADKLLAEMKKIPALRDLQFDQALDYPTVDIKVDRKRAGQLGVTVEQVGRSLVAATSSSRFTQPVYWRDPASGTAYQVQVEIPQAQMSSVEDVQSVPVNAPSGVHALAGDVAEIGYGTAVGQYDRYNQQRMVTIIGNIAGKDLGSVSREIDAAIQRAGEVPRGVTVAVRGQIPPMQQTLSGLQTGLLLAVAVIFLLLTANFQSLRVSLAILAMVPAVVAGVVVALWLTGTTLNVQSFMGAIMAIGVSVANAILLVTFAEQRRREGLEADAAATDGAKSRLRPILMTSVAMIAGMIPMALAVGEGGQQTAPLGRAVIGGLAASTIAVLTVLPLVFAIAQRKASRIPASLHPETLTNNE